MGRCKVDLQWDEYNDVGGGRTVQRETYRDTSKSVNWPRIVWPNSLFIGWASDRIAAGPFQAEEMFDPDLKQVRSRFNLVQGLTNQFWKNWTTLYFPSLLIRQKWHTSKRNLCVGDVCLLQDSNCLRGEWRLCKVSETYSTVCSYYIIAYCSFLAFKLFICPKGQWIYLFDFIHKPLS